VIAVGPTHLLHLLARAALRMLPPLRAKRAVDFAACCLPRLGGTDEACGLASKLDGHGSCLSRALTIAARLPGSDVVIAVDPRLARPLYAHAWVEVAGRALRASDIGGQEIVRLDARY
jgi:hypothetical protein